MRKIWICDSEVTLPYMGHKTTVDGILFFGNYHHWEIRVSEKEKREILREIKKQQFFNYPQKGDVLIDLQELIRGYIKFRASKIYIREVGEKDE